MSITPLSTTQSRADIAGEYVRARLDAGDTPNQIADAIDFALSVHAPPRGWAQWGDGEWRLETVCSVCGSQLAGVCGHEKVPGRRVILRSEYEAAKTREAR